MQISRHADYACRVLIYLATTESERCSVEAIAQSFSISQNHLVKIVHELGKLGYLKTTRGRGGGIALAKSGEKIIIGKVIRDMEPSLIMAECFDPDTNSCPIASACGLKPWLSKATKAFFKTLDDVNLNDIAKRQRKLRAILF